MSFDAKKSYIDPRVSVNSYYLPERKEQHDDESPIRCD